MLDPWDQRKTPETQIRGLIAAMEARFAAIADAEVLVFPPPPIPGLGTAGGFTFQLEGLGGQSSQELTQVLNGLIATARAGTQYCLGLFHLRRHCPATLSGSRPHPGGIPECAGADVFSTLQSVFGSTFVNNFTYLGQTYQVNVQADKIRAVAGGSDQRDLCALRHRRMVPVGVLAEVRMIWAPIWCFATTSSLPPPSTAAPPRAMPAGEAMAAMAEAAKKALPGGLWLRMDRLSFQEAQQSGGSEAAIFGLAVLFGYLFLVALYESWAIPFSVLTSVTVAVLGAAGGL